MMKVDALPAVAPKLGLIGGVEDCPGQAVEVMTAYDRGLGDALSGLQFGKLKYDTIGSQPEFYFTEDCKLGITTSGHLSFAGVDTERAISPVTQVLVGFQLENRHFCIEIGENYEGLFEIIHFGYQWVSVVARTAVER